MNLLVPRLDAAPESLQDGFGRILSCCLAERALMDAKHPPLPFVLTANDLL